MDSTSFLLPILDLADGAAGWVAGLMFLVAGFVPIRRALPRAGYMVGAAGASLLVSSCCLSWGGPAAAWFDLRPPPILFMVSSMGSLITFLACFGLIIAAAVTLATAVPKQESAGPPEGAS